MRKQNGIIQNMRFIRVIAGLKFMQHPCDFAQKLFLQAFKTDDVFGKFGMFEAKGVGVVGDVLENSSENYAFLR